MKNTRYKVKKVCKIDIKNIKSRLKISMNNTYCIVKTDLNQFLIM